MGNAMATPPKSASEYRAALGAMIVEMDQMDARSRETWRDIERLKAESAVLGMQSDQTLERISARLNAIESLL